MSKRSRQISFQDPRLKRQPFFGGSNTTKRSHRTARPISTKHPMHLILRSTQAIGNRSFLAPKNVGRIKSHLRKLSAKFGVKIVNAANVGNHIHLCVKLSNRRTYKPFICALTGAIARTVLSNCGSTGGSNVVSAKKKFWNYRPYSRIVESRRAFVILRDYFLINRLEGIGVSRARAVFLVKGSDP